MRVLIALFLVGWLAILPPFFTNGKCTAEFEAVSSRFETQRNNISKLEPAKKWLDDSGDHYAEITQSSCRASRPRFIADCGNGSILYLKVPVKERVCRMYRDDATRVQLHYDDKGRLARIISEMAPYKSLPLPGGNAVHWAN